MMACQGRHAGTSENQTETLPTGLNGEGAGEDYLRLAGVGVAHFADAVEFFAAALELGFHGAEVGGGNDEDHAHA